MDDETKASPAGEEEPPSGISFAPDGHAGTATSE